MIDRVRSFVRATKPVNSEFVEAMRRRWAALPDSARTPGQTLGRHGVGCEGTHGVFPRCNLACTPCYHSRDANRVRVDGKHTLDNVRAQMRLLRRERGPRAHAQLIGGEVSLLPPDDHAAALLEMRAHGREPMSFTHGDFDESYLRALALDADGRPRFSRLSFAAHFDKMMFGRRGIERPESEAALQPYRERFAAMFPRLRGEHGVRFFLAHNMTVTPANVDEVAEVIAASRNLPFGMYSFQPAAFVGDDRRWHEDYRDVTPDAVWQQIERGAGAALDYRMLENGDVRCNRTAWGCYVGDRWHPWLDAADPRDVATRDAFFRYVGDVSFGAEPGAVLAVKMLRLLARRPQILGVALPWAWRFARRIGVLTLLRERRIRSVTFVMHQFMDAAEVAPAWALLQQGQHSDDPAVRGVQERLQACHYAMAHPEDGTLVPACVQHSLLDPAENVELRRLLPIVETRSTTPR